MSEERNQEQENKADHAEKGPDTAAGEDASEEKVAEEEESGGALPQNRSDES